MIQDWAKSHLTSLILDTDTTGLRHDAEICEIAITRGSRVIYTTLVKPSKPIPLEATAIHGISNEHVINAPIFPKIYCFLRHILYGKDVLIYNANFDKRILDYCCLLHELLTMPFTPHCVMLSYSEFIGERTATNRIKWQKLPRSREHRASADCFATYEVIRQMAGVV